MPSNTRSLLLLLVLLVATAAAPAVSQGGGLLNVAPTALPAGSGLAPLDLPRTLGSLPDTLHGLDASDLISARRLQIDTLVRRHRDLVDRDANGAPMLRSEVVAIDPTDEALARARDAGFTRIDERMIAELELRVVVLRSPPGIGTRSALRRLRRLDPTGSYDFNHLYFFSAASNSATSAPALAIPSARRPVRVGLIDGGVARQHPALAGVDVQSWGCDGRPHADAHGTAVASLLVGNGGQQAAPGTVLYAADIYCGQPVGGAVTGFVQAMAWMARERVAVINLSLVGPDNQLLERAARSLLARGHVLVAAVGNDGPAAPPLYPAAYPMVIGVTGVDRRKRVLPEAGRGRQVDFAATGSELRVARPAGDWATARGTSFAAPLVARAAAQLVSAPGEGEVARVYAQLARQSLDLGAAGRDDSYGQGLLKQDAEEIRPPVRNP